MLAPALLILTLASGVPYINIAKTCRAAQATGISIDQKAAYEGCVADEKEAKETLIRTWSRLTPSNRQSCVDESTGMSPSYVEMLTCLEMRDGGKFTGGASPAVPPSPKTGADAGTPAGSTPASPVPGTPPPVAPGTVPNSSGSTTAPNSGSAVGGKGGGPGAGAGP